LGGIFPVLIILFAISHFVRGMVKQARSGRPGQGGAGPAPGGGPAGARAAQRPAGPGRPSPAPARPAQPETDSAAYAGAYDGMLDESDRARTDLSEGESRECDHGSVGGSMDITSHAGMGEEYERAKPEVQPLVRTSASSARPAAEPDAMPADSITRMTAAQMRQAVIMAEILRRPSERRRAGRWSVR